MRRVYYTFMLRIAMHPVTTQAVLFIVSLAVFAKLVHVSRIVEALMNTTLGNIPHYILNTVVHAFMRGEVMTLIAVGVLVFTALSIPRSVYKVVVPNIHTRVTA